ncbi:MAG: hypothetical protein IH598_00180 [Bacteroidales bacterium]|nr:hypothetical protein [Bacteroidales bacterium]
MNAQNVFIPKFTVMAKTSVLLFLMFLCFFASAQQRDTLKVTITEINKRIKPDTIFSFSSRVDTIALQAVKTDTSKIVRDVNVQDLEDSKYNVKFMGSARVNGYFDFAGLTSTEGFIPYEIPVGVGEIPGLSSIYIGARQSRIGVEGNANTKVGKIKTYLEVDFASNTESYLRLRHAYAEWNYLKLGYTWSTFMDNASLPQTVEFEGPNSSLSKRHGLIRYERIVKPGNIIGVSLESPKADYYNPADTILVTSPDQRNLDVAGRYKYFDKWGHVQVAGIIRKIDFIQQGKIDTQLGWGILLSTTLFINKHHQINSQYSIGKGISYYSVGLTRRQLDAVYDPNTNTMILKDIGGGFINYSFKPVSNIVLSAIAGISHIECHEFESGDSFRSSQYYGANAFYNPIETISLGIEITAGTRKNFDNQIGGATRISMLAKFDF